MANMKPMNFGSNDDKAAIFDRPAGWNRFSKILKTCQRIPNAELSELVVLAKGGCSVSKEKVVRSCLRLVVTIAKQYLIKNKAQTFHLMDMIQAGCEGVLRAIDNYEAMDNCSFPSYAMYPIRGRIMSCFPLMDSIKRPLPLKKSPLIEVVSLSTVLEEGIYTELLADYIPDPSMSLTEQEYSIESFRIDLERTLYTLTERENEVIQLYLMGGKSLEDIGAMYGVTAERIRQIIGKAITKLRSNERNQLLTDHRSFVNGDGFRVYEKDYKEQESYVEFMYERKRDETTKAIAATTISPKKGGCEYCGKYFTKSFMPIHMRHEHPEQVKPEKQPAKIEQAKQFVPVKQVIIEQPKKREQAKPQLTIPKKQQQIKPQPDIPKVPTNTYTGRRFLLGKQGTIEALKSFAEHNHCSVTTIKVLLFKIEPDIIQFNEYINGRFNRVLKIKEDILNIQKYDFMQWQFKFSFMIAIVLNDLMDRLIKEHGSCKKSEVRVLFYIKKEEQDTPYIQYYKEGDPSGGQYLSWDELTLIFAS